MKTWYIRNNDEHLGPYSLDELRLLGLYSDDYVWQQGLPSWTKACQIPELTDVLIELETAANTVTISTERNGNHLKDCPSYTKLNRINRSISRIFNGSSIRRWLGVKL